MSARAAIELGIYSGLIPAAAALLLYWVLGWLLPASVAERYRLAAAFAVAVFVGFAVSPTTKSIAPERFWDWVPYLGLLAAFAAGVAHAEGISRVERWAMIVLVSSFAAWLIVPTWDELAPARPVQLALLTLGIAALTMLLEPLAMRLPGRAFPAWLMLAAGTCAVVIMAEVSEMFGRLAALPASALLGCAIAGWFLRQPADWRGIALPYSVVVGGYAFTGAIYPTPPLTLLMLLPFALLVLWLCARGPLARLTGVRAAAAQAVCVLVPLVTIAALIIMRSAGDEW